MRRTRLLDDDVSVPLEDMRLDFAALLVEQRLNRDFSREDAGAGLADADWTQRVGGARETQWRL